MEAVYPAQTPETPQQREHSTLEKGSLISKCANPACFTPFRYLHPGRLFCFGEVPGAARRTDGMPFRWLCGTCSSAITLDLDKSGEVVLRQLHSRAS